ncbi:MAG: DUF551 domain-containing protein [Marinobacter sp.]|nr:DUF551 domain-containing protein [Marinobacter sp.]
MWIDCRDRMPKDLVVVIALYLGHWPRRGNGGITDAYAYNGTWFNIPEGVTIAGWMPIPDTVHMDIPEQSANPGMHHTQFLGAVETDNPGILECVFEGDRSELGRRSIRR